MGLSHASRWVSLSLSAPSIAVARRNQFVERNCSIIMSCSSTSENRTQVKACEKCSNSNKDDDWKSSECNDFGGMEDRSMNENKIDILLGEVRRLGHQMECLSLKFQLFEKELRQRRPHEDLSLIYQLWTVSRITHNSTN
ncbi:hypothetical protein WN944_018728 [Citrus x changshan-huyou]|uniref:Uncharacterized protein n=1 Tax=Citrus x changshan-huyou TaxID=2935761 RepID=A0AAP0LUY0_9ROSI